MQSSLRICQVARKLRSLVYLMYELICPSCQLVQRSSFVRVGAVVSCPQCGLRYQVEKGHIKRKLKAEVEAEKAASMLDEDAEPLRLDPSGSMVGLSGLSDMMRDESGPEEPGLDDTQQMTIAIASLAHEDEEEDDVSQVRVGDVPADFMISKGWQRRRSSRSIYVILGLLTLIVAVLGFGIMYTTMGLKNSTQLPPGGDVTLVPGKSYASAHRMEASPWEVVNAPHVPPIIYRPVARVTDQRLERDENGQSWYLATVSTTEPGIIGDATFHLSLVDFDGTEVQRMSMPLALISARYPAKIRIKMPNIENMQDLRRADWVEVDPALSKASVVSPDRLVLVPSRSGRKTLLSVTAYNNTPRTIRNWIFIVKALDHDGRAIATYSIRWDKPVDPSRPINFYAAAPINPNADLASWTIEAAAQ
ncbi:hypothetical protein [Poriferisphaera sp. WC338]|uniref:hypothetical protein n=1 Tax=Poriferisphaera sp. WC338 TaxID=3425129 RepID=UPI003D814731